MANLSTQTSKINAVLSLNNCTDINGVKENLQLWCVSNCKMFAFILHDKDKLDSGAPKTPHIHLVAVLNSSRLRISTTLNNISDAVKLSTMAISIEKLNDINGSIQYLVHKNNADKFHYDINDIVTNLERTELDIYMTSENDAISLETLITIVKRNTRIVDIIRDVGLQNYRLYRNVIWDIYSEVHLS